MIGQLSVGGRLAGGFGLLMVLTLVQAAVGLHYLGASKERIDQLYEREVIAMSGIAQKKSDLYRLRLDAIAFVGGADAKAQSEITTRMMATRDRLYEWSSRYVASAVGPVEQQLASAFAQEFHSFGIHLDQAIGTRVALSREGERVFAKADALLNDIIKFNEERAQTRQQFAVSDYDNAVVAVALVSSALFLLGWFIAVVITRSITRPLHEVVSATDRIAAGDLTVELDAGRQDELGRVLAATDNMARQLAGLVNKVRGCTNAISAAAGRMIGASSELARRTEDQASSLAETASSVEEITAAAIQNADHSSQTHGIVAATSESAVSGAQAMDELSRQMEASYQAAQRIASISQIIRDMAFQTNILSLNAAVEAARAGENGQGFAVVAAEVRSLAMRSAEAAKDVKQLVDDSLQKFSASKELVAQAVGRMSEITTQVKKASEVLEEIAATSREQSAGIQQVNQAVMKLDQITQHNLESSEETASAARSLEQSANMLEEAVGRFKLHEMESSQAPAPVAPPALPPRERLRLINTN
jgi:methyl-accepting chemotaxis protein